MGRAAVGLGPPCPRPRRTFRALRARRRPADRGGSRGHGLRPPRVWAARAVGAATSSAGRSTTTTSRHGWRTSAPAPRVGRSSCTRTRLADSSRPAISWTTGRSRISRSCRRRRSIRGCRAGRSDWRRSSGGSRRRSRSRTASTATWLSRDPSVAAKTADDPLVCQGQHRSFRCARRSPSRPGSGLRHRAASGSRPSSFTARRTDSSRPMLQRSSPMLPLVERRTYPDLRHELHNEPEGPAIVDEIIAWLRERAAGVPVGHAGRSPLTE